jgi:hypothetical protein
MQFRGNGQNNKEITNWDDDGIVDLENIYDICRKLYKRRIEFEDYNHIEI